MKSLYFIIKALIVFAISSSPVIASSNYCKPSEPCWPNINTWQELNKKVNGNLIRVTNPLNKCHTNPSSRACKKVLDNFKNPYVITSTPAVTQLTGWLDAWISTPSTYAIKAHSAQDISEGVKFAKKHNIKLVIKGTGHDYLGRSNAADSLLIWTHPMRKVEIIEKFVPKGCPVSTTPKPALTALAGTRWIEAYKKASVENNRYVQGGGCASVGVAGGFLQGGGFGSLSKKYGIAAAGLLEAEVVTADGKLLTANACQNKDLFWSLKGGGGGTFGVVTKVTLLTHDMPKTLGGLNGVLTAPNDLTYKELIIEFLKFYKKNLNNENWGEQITFTSNNTLQLNLLFTNESDVHIESLINELKEQLKKINKHYQIQIKPIYIPGSKFWDLDYRRKNLPKSVIIDPRSGHQDYFWWKGNNSEVSLYLGYYYSSYVPYFLLEDKNIKQFAEALFKASRYSNDVVIHFNKGQYNAAKEAVERGKATSMHPGVFDAIGMIIIAGGKQYYYPSIDDNNKQLKKDAKQAKKAFMILRKLMPNAGTYANEADYHQTNWQQDFWGKNYDHLLEVKQKYDPDNLFSCHHCIGDN